jgi:hypothetical protein
LGFGFLGFGLWGAGVPLLGLAALVCGWPGFGFRQPTHTHTQLQPGRGSGGLGGLPHGLPKHACLRPGNWPHQQRCTLPCMHVPGRCRHAGFHLSQVACMHAQSLASARQGMLACMHIYIYATHTQPQLSFTSLGPPSPCPGEGLLPVELVPAPLQVPWVDTLLGQPAWPA